MRVRRCEVSSWISMGWIACLLVTGCAAAESPAPEPLPAGTTPTVMAPELPLGSGATPLPTSSPTLRPRPTPTRTPGPRVEVVLMLADCDWTFGDPFLRERRLMNVLEEPGILEVVSRGQREVRLIYDPTRLTPEEAVRAFERASGFRTGGEAVPNCP